MKYLLFDLDGTLTESGTGIIKGVQYALKSVGIEETDEEKLRLFIGPPLEESFETHYGFTGADAEHIIEKYREYYHVTGVYENAPYEGVTEMLAALREKEFFLAVASSKPQNMVDIVLRHFDLERFFEVRIGSSPERELISKSDVIEAVLEEIGKTTGKAKETVRPDAIMIGDRKYDILGAHESGLPCIGVLYGYGTREELTEFGADYLAATPGEIVELI